MKSILLLFGGLVATVAIAQDGTNYVAPAPGAAVQPPAVQTAQLALDNGVVLQELSPPQRAGRRGGVYVTGAPPVPAATTTTYVSTTNLVRTNGAGATGPTTTTNVGTGESYETITERPGIYVPTFNNPGIPGAIGGIGGRSTSGSNPANTATPASNTTVPFLPPLGAPAGTLGPALPPPGTATPPPGPGADLPGSRIVLPPRPITTLPPPITSPSR